MSYSNTCTHLVIMLFSAILITLPKHLALNICNSSNTLNLGIILFNYTHTMCKMLIFEDDYQASHKLILVRL